MTEQVIAGVKGSIWTDCMLCGNRVPKHKAKWYTPPGLRNIDNHGPFCSTTCMNAHSVVQEL